MENPYSTTQEVSYYLAEKEYFEKDEWMDIDGFFVDVEGYYIILCTVSINTGHGANVGFSLVDSGNQPIAPFRTTTNNRVPVHFSYEPCTVTPEDLTPVTFHLVAHCKGPVKLRLMSSDGGTRLNGAFYNRKPALDKIFLHKPISVMSAIPLCGAIKQKNNTMAPQPIGRAASMPVEEEDKKPAPKHPGKKPKGRTSML